MHKLTNFRKIHQMQMKETTYVVVAEWLRRLTRNQMGYSRTGSNPVHDGQRKFFPS